MQIYIGGVCLYIKNSIAFNVRGDICSTKLNQSGLNFSYPKQNLSLSGHAIYVRFVEDFEDTLTKIPYDIELIILGDFNVDYASKRDNMLSQMKDILQSFHCKQLINSPTRLCRTRASILDHIICNSVNKITQSGTIGVGISDHQFLIVLERSRKGSLKRGTMKSRFAPLKITVRMIF